MQITLQQFLDYLSHERQLSIHTIDSYQRAITHLHVSLNDEISCWTSLRGEHIKLWIAGLRQKGIAPRSIAAKLSAVRSFCHYLLAHELISQDPCIGISAPKRGKPLPKNINVDDINQLLNILFA